MNLVLKKEKIEYLPQYAEEIFEQIPPKTENMEYLILCLLEILVTVQSVETILKAAELLKDDPVRFHIVGGGTDLERLAEDKRR